MYTIEFGEKIRNIHLVPDESPYDDIFLYSKIIVETSQFIIFEPNPETDEIVISIESTLGQKPINAQIYSGLNDKKLIDLWRCTNESGYFDQAIIAVDILRPAISFLCECGLLGIYSSSALDLKS